MNGEVAIPLIICHHDDDVGPSRMRGGEGANDGERQDT